MYEKYIKDALPYYNPDGVLKEYRFTKKQILELIDECLKNKEQILGIVVLLNPSETEYGEACGFFNTDVLKIDSVNKISLLAKEYISSIDEGEEHVFYSLELESGHLIPKLVL